MAVSTNSFVSPQEPFSRTAICTAAETAFHNPTNMVTLLSETDNTDGAVIFRLFAITRAANAGSNNCQLYKKVGSVYTLIDSVLLAVVTPSATVANGKIDFGYSPDSPLYLASGEGLAVAIGSAIANGVVFRTDGGLY
jgi:hypothetical protein